MGLSSCKNSLVFLGHLAVVYFLSQTYLAIKQEELSESRKAVPALGLDHVVHFVLL